MKVLSHSVYFTATGKASELLGTFKWYVDAELFIKALKWRKELRLGNTYHIESK